MDTFLGLFFNYLIIFITVFSVLWGMFLATITVESDWNDVKIKKFFRFIKTLKIKNFLQSLGRFRSKIVIVLLVVPILFLGEYLFLSETFQVSCRNFLSYLWYSYGYFFVIYNIGMFWINKRVIQDEYLRSKTRRIIVSSLVVNIVLVLVYVTVLVL